MYLIAILIAIVALQLWGSRNRLHRDEWFARWSALLARAPLVSRHPGAQLLLAVGLPTGGVLTAVVLWPPLLWFVLAVVVLLYSLGRGEFAPDVKAYALACGDSAWPVASAKARQQGVDTDAIAVSDWPELNKKMLEATAYQGFERLFAVLFWFLLAGPAGALLYRLLFLYVQQADAERSRQRRLAADCLTVIEWPAVRALGLSLAITGNFVGCINRWKNLTFVLSGTSACVLRESVLGALSVDDEMMQCCDCTQREVTALKRLYARTLWFWVGGLALVTLLY